MRPEIYQVSLTVQDIQTALHASGFGANVGEIDGVWGLRTAASVVDFQEAWFGDPVEVDGIVGPRTAEALLASAASGGQLSEHFRVAEFRCSHCGETRVRRSLVDGLERLRALRGEPLPIVSGYRCREHNRSVGGASLSAHIYGLAADIPARFTEAEATSTGAFGGIGVDGASGLVLHVDVRHDAYPHEEVGPGSPGAPALWQY